MERLYEYCVNLKPPGGNHEAILRKVRFTKERPLWIPVQGHRTAKRISG